MNTVHFIVRDRLFVTTVDPRAHTYTSGNHSISVAQAEACIGRTICLHQTKSERSYFGGTITGFEVIADGEYAGCIIFALTATREGRNQAWTGDDYAMARWSGIN